MIRTGRRLAAAALTATLALGATACGGDDSGGDTGGDTKDPSPSADSTSAPASGSAEPTDSASADAGVPAATGVELTQTVVAVNAPDGWEADEAPVDFSSSARGPGRSDTLLLVDNPSLAGPGATIDDLYDSFVRLNKGDPDLTYERLADLDLAGTPASYVHSTRKGSKAEEFTVTAVHAERVVTLTFTLDPGTLQQDPQLVESVLASLRWLD